MNFDLLRPVVFANLKVGDKLVSPQECEAVVAYIAHYFVVLRFQDNSEGAPFGSYLERQFKIQPLCWVEDKPVYPGDELYRPELEGDKALVASHITRSEFGVEYLHFSNLTGANEYADNRRSYLSWTKPEQKRAPSFQVEGQVVYPGDTVYYYGYNKETWHAPYTVRENSRVSNNHTGSTFTLRDYHDGAASFRLKPMLVIGDRLVPMPVREPLEEGEGYFTPSLYNTEAVGYNTWRDTTYDRMCLKAGLIHHTTKAAADHGEALLALSRRKG